MQIVPEKFLTFFYHEQVTDADIIKAGEISIISHNIDQNVLCKLFYDDLIINEEKDSTRELDLLWLSSWCFTNSRPQWLDCTQSALILEKHPGKSEIIFLPMIEFSASNDSCIYSTIYFIAQQCDGYEFSPVLTFDQPLWWKAMMVVANALISCATRKIN